MRTIAVERVGHVNHVAADYDAVVAAYRRVLGGVAFSEWALAPLGTRNALVTVSDACVELFSPDLGEGPMASWLRHNPPGWHSLEWTVASLEEAADVCAERGIRVTDLAPGQYLFTHPRDGHGLCLELTEHHFLGDPRDDEAVAPQPSFWRDEHPLGIAGLAGIQVRAPAAGPAAEWLAALTGGELTGPADRPGLRARAVGVRLPGHTIEFLEPVGDGPYRDLVEARGARLHAVVLAVADLDRARRHLDDLGVACTTGSSAGSLAIDPGAMAGAAFELVAADRSS